MNWRYVIPAESMNQREGMRVTKAMLDKLPCPDVVVCLNDAIALGAIHELQRCGLNLLCIFVDFLLFSLVFAIAFASLSHNASFVYMILVLGYVCQAPLNTIFFLSFY